MIKRKPIREYTLEAVAAVISGSTARFEFESTDDSDALLNDFIDVIITERKNLINWEKAAFYAGIACGVSGAEDPTGDFNKFWENAHGDVDGRVFPDVKGNS